MFDSIEYKIETLEAKVKNYEGLITRLTQPNYNLLADLLKAISIEASSDPALLEIVLKARAYCEREAAQEHGV